MLNKCSSSFEGAPLIQNGLLKVRICWEVHDIRDKNKLKVDFDSRAHIPASSFSPFQTASDDGAVEFFSDSHQRI